MAVILDSIYEMSQIVIFQQNIYVFTMTLFLQQHFYSHHLLFYAHYYHLLRMNIFVFSLTNVSIAAAAASSFILSTINLF